MRLRLRFYQVFNVSLLHSCNIETFASAFCHYEDVMSQRGEGCPKADKSVNYALILILIRVPQVDADEADELEEEKARKASPRPCKAPFV